LIYAVWAEGSPFVKIGWASGNIRKRVMVLQVGCPWPLQLLATIEGTMDDEQAIHLMLQHSVERGEVVQARCRC
jgi:hypothetical protein